MSNLAIPPNKTKIVVDSYDDNGEVITCYCTNGTQEIDYEVTQRELYIHVIGSDKKVWVSVDPENTVSMSFVDWIGTNPDLTHDLGQIINKREVLTEEIELPDLHPLFQSILSPFLTSKIA